MTIDFKSVANLLRKGLGQRPVSEWRQEVKPYTESLLVAISDEFAQRSGGLNLELHENQGGARISLTTLHYASCKFFNAMLADGSSFSLDLNVSIGFSSRQGDVPDLTKKLVWGVSTWGTEKWADKIIAGYRHIHLENLTPEFTLATVRPGYFGGAYAMAFRAVTADELESADTTELISQIARDLNTLLVKMRQNKNRFLEFLGVPPDGDGMTPQQVKALVEQFGQVILYGPPGTGKTRLARQVALLLLDDAGKLDADLLDDNARVASELLRFSTESSRRFELVVFHPSYEYEQFIGGITATPSEDGKMSYTVEEGTFLRLCDAERAVLVIDEINRGNLSKLLGELLYALEYRDSAVTLPFERPGRSAGKRRELTVPQHLFIIATMNSADRSIGHIDVAVRRRFALVPIPAEPKVVTSEWKRRFDDDGERFGVQLRGLMTWLNETLRTSSEGGEIGVGQSYFLPGAVAGSIEKAKEVVRNRWKYQVCPLLKEYQLMANANLAYLEDPWRRGKMGVPSRGVLRGPRAGSLSARFPLLLSARGGAVARSCPRKGASGRPPSKRSTRPPSRDPVSVGRIHTG